MENSTRKFLSDCHPDVLAYARSYPLNPDSPACPELSTACSGCPAFLDGECVSRFAIDARIRRTAVRMVAKINIKTLLLFVLVAVPLFEILNVLLFNFTH
jgi:hypothetical protein